jgi:hypothetical protein
MTAERLATTFAITVTLRRRVRRTHTMPTLSVRIDLDGGERIGPGKIALLRAVGETG